MLKLRADSGVVALWNHVTSEKKRAMYISKSKQNDLLQCIKGII